MPKVLFLLSLPRSGSTWLQRILASNREICTTAESWLLLPLFDAVMQGRALTEYNQSLANKAIADFFAKHPDKKESYYRGLAQQARECLLSYCDEKQEYFLEKTPRNYILGALIPEFFSGDKYIFLWRDPVEIAISMAKTWGGRWDTLYRYEMDFSLGFQKLLDAADRLGDRAVHVLYKDMLERPDATLGVVYDYLEMSHGSLSEAATGREKIQGTMGDKKFLGQVRSMPLSRGEKRNITKLIKPVPDRAFQMAGTTREASLQRLAAEETRLFEPTDLLTPLLWWAYKNQLAPNLKRLRGETAIFPAFGVE